LDKTENINALVAQLQQKLGLKKNPFAASLDVFYEGAQRQHNLETIRHLAIFGDMVLLLTGEKGAGKTQIIERFTKSHAQDVDLHIVSGRREAGAAAAIQRLAALASVQAIEGEPSSVLLDRLLQRYDQLFKQRGKRSLVIIDDADQLPHAELYGLIQAFRSQPPESGAALMLAGLPVLLDVIHEKLDESTDEWLHQIHLKPLSKEEMKDYLQLRLKAAGSEGDVDLDGAQLEHLANMGKGLPGRINRVFVNVMLGEELFPANVERHADRVSQRVLFGIAAILFLSFVFVGFQHGLFEFDSASSSDEELTGSQMAEDANLEEKRKEKVTAEEDHAEQMMARLARIDRAIAQTGGVGEDNALALGDSVKSGAQGGAEERKDASLEASRDNSMMRKPSSSVMDEGIDNAPSPVSGKGDDSPSQDSKLRAGSEDESFVKDVESSAEAVFYDPEPIKTAPPTHEDKRDPYFRNRNWVMRQPGSDYSLQVLGSYNIETAKRFIRDAESQLRDKLFYLQTTYKGRIWYIVMYGQFESKTLARQAVTSSPDYIRKQKPWIRSFAGILKSYP